MTPLLAPDEAPAVEVFNQDGRADLLIICDHASRRVPRALGDLGLPPTAFDRHIAWDIGAAEVAKILAARFDAPLVLSGYSRLALDLNRGLDHPGSMPVESDGQVVPGNQGLDDAARRARVIALYEPYHGRIAEKLVAFHDAGRIPAMLSVHSCTPVFKGIHRPWEIGVLWNRDARMAQPLIAALRAMKGLTIGDNEPYSGQGGEGHTVKRHAEAAGLPHVSLEIRQDLIDTHKGARHWAKIVGDGLAPVLADRALYRRGP